MIKYIIIVLLLLSCSTNATGSMKLDFNLNNVNKISIESAKYSPDPYQKIVISTQEEIKFIINELNTIKSTGGIDTIVQYNVIFYEDDTEILMVGLNLNLNYPGSSFIRHSNYTVDDYLISRSFFDFLKDKLKKKTKVDNSKN